MCDRCEKIVIKEQGILESDLQLLPFKWVYWHCIVEGCKGKCREYDFGNSPFFFDPCKRKRTKNGWRGGWFDATVHYYMCGKHSKYYSDRQEEVPFHSEKQLLAKVTPVKSK